MNVAITSGHWEVRRSKLGHPFTVWIEPVPRIPDELADSIVYLYPSEAAAQDGLQQGGSGFLCGADLSVGRLMATYVVTNKHVIRSGAMIARLNSRDGTHDILPLDGAEWFEHPDGDDIAICPVGLNFAAHRQTVFPLSQCVSEEWVKQFDIGLGDDVFMIGRFVGHEGRLQNTPSVRFGVISQTPSEPIIQEDGFGQISYLVEARSIPGYSGSPVFITIESHGPKPNLNPQLGQDLQDMVIKQIGWMKGRAGPAGFRYGPFLLGIDYCHLYDKQRMRGCIASRLAAPRRKSFAASRNQRRRRILYQRRSDTDDGRHWLAARDRQAVPLRSLIKVIAESVVRLAEVPRALGVLGHFA